MDFDQLEIFLEVARLSSFSRAAEKRFRTQPAVSSQIRALEEEVGARLLDRSGGRVSLTASGKLFFKYAEETIEHRKTILTEIAETERVPRGEIVVGANEGTCLHLSLIHISTAPTISARFWAATCSASSAKPKKSATKCKLVSECGGKGALARPAHS